jgi:hypothetical protein
LRKNGKKPENTGKNIVKERSGDYPNNEEES